MPESQVFISYSHKNKKDLEMVRKHLKYLEEKYHLSIWDDQCIQPGARWRQAIETALAEAKVAVLLVSADFLASKFIAETELPVLLQAAEAGKVTLLSIVISPCAFDETPLTQFQAFDQPLLLMSKGKREQTLSLIAKHITAILRRSTEEGDSQV